MQTTEDLLQLATTRRTDALEEAWMAVTGTEHGADADWPALVQVIEALADAGQSDLAEVLAWTALSGALDSIPADQLLPFASGVLRRFEQNADLRAEVVKLYRMVFADVEGADAVIDRSGLADGSKSVRLALRVIETCVVLEPGTFLVDRGGEDVAEVIARKPDRSRFTLRTPIRTADVAAEQLAADFRLADPDDFRVLAALRPDRLTELVDKDPVTLVTGILHAHGNRIVTDELKYALCPRYLPLDRWSKWWTKARSALKREDTIKIEGRSPVVLTYHSEGRSLERDARAALEKASTPAELRSVVEHYLREAKHLKATPDRACLRTLAESLDRWIETWRANRPADALSVALVRHQSLTPLMDGDASSETSAVARLLHDVDDVPVLLAALPDARSISSAIEIIRQALPEKWVDIYVKCFGRAPRAACDAIDRALTESGNVDRLREAVADVLNRPADAIEAFTWLWERPKRAAALGAPDPKTLFGQTMTLLADVQRSASMPREQVNAIRGAVRSALGAGQCEAFRRVIAEADEGMGAVYRRQIERADGLSPTLQSRLLNIVRERFPNLYVTARVLPWEDETVIFTTEQGLSKTKAALAEIVNVKMKENSIAIGEAAARGDLSENSEYKFALEERDLLQARASRMSEQIDKARVLRRDDVPDDVVSIGSRVTLRPENGGAPRCITILGPWDADPDQGIFNYQTPISQSVLGRRRNDEVRVSLDGNDIRYTIERVEPGL